MSGVHLIYTSLVTEKRLKIHKEAKNNGQRKRIDLFLSAIKSLEKLPIISADFFIEFDETTSYYQEAVMNIIDKMNFPKNIYNKRLSKYEEWKKNSEQNIDNSLILLLTYDDHTFIDSSIDEFNYLLENVKIIEEYLQQPIYGCLSHFPESHGSIPFAKALGRYKNINGVPIVPCAIPIGAIILSSISYKKWWETDFTNGSKIVSPENPFGPSVSRNDSWQIFPRNELFRHMDGYSHVGILNRPYGVLRADYEFNSNLEMAYYPYIKSSNLKKIRADQDYDLLESVEERFNYKKNLLLANQKRISIESIKYISTKYNDPLSKNQLFRLFFKYSNVKFLQVKTVLELPTVFFLRTYFVIYKQNKKELSSDMIRFTMLMASHRTIRFITIFSVDKIKLFCFKKFSVVTGRRNN